MVIVVAAGAILGGTTQIYGAPDATCSFSRLVEQVAERFQRGDEPADCEQIKQFIVRLTDDGDRYWDAVTVGPGPKLDTLRQTFFKTVANFFEYVDSHRLRSSDVIEIREWMAESLDTQAGPRYAFAMRAWSVFHLASHDTPRTEGTPEPRHTLLLCLISQPLISLPGISEAVVSHAQGKSEIEHFWRGTKAFLTAPENEALWEALLETSRALLASKTNDDYVHAVDRCAQLIDEMKTRDGNPEAFNKALEEFMQTFETRCIVVHPDFALPERYLDILSLRDAWVITSTRGNDLAKKKFLALIARLRLRYEKQSDRVTVKWLDQVVESPERATEKPPEKDRHNP